MPPVPKILILLLLALVVAQLCTGKRSIWSTDGILEKDDDLKSEAFRLIATLVDYLTTILRKVHRNVLDARSVAAGLGSVDTP